MPSRDSLSQLETYCQICKHQSKRHYMRFELDPEKNRSRFGRSSKFFVFLDWTQPCFLGIFDAATET